MTLVSASRIMSTNESLFTLKSNFSLATCFISSLYLLRLNRNLCYEECQFTKMKMTSVPVVFVNTHVICFQSCIGSYTIIESLTVL